VHLFAHEVDGLEFVAVLVRDLALLLLLGGLELVLE
jgi:hypothetical protein